MFSRSASVVRGRGALSWASRLPPSSCAIQYAAPPKMRKKRKEKKYRVRFEKKSIVNGEKFQWRKGENAVKTVGERKKLDMKKFGGGRR
mmetsp:Transcript_23642/g.59557  ORF Transcript_23642/g.59557 Transcript_23642/m.59557 type:complete len:89 (+) Transcript_23642:1965-2231(+)